MAFQHLMGLLPLLLVAGPAVANDPSPLEPAFSNTIVSTYPDGKTGKLWLERDGSYRAEGRRAERSSGRWKVKDGRMCFKQSRPLPIPFSYCSAVVSGDVGSVWAGKAVTGEPLRIQLVAGR